MLGKILNLENKKVKQKQDLLKNPHPHYMISNNKLRGKLKKKVKSQGKLSSNSDF